MENWRKLQTDPVARVEWAKKRWFEDLAQYAEFSHCTGVQIIVNKRAEPFCRCADFIAGAYRLNNVPEFPPPMCEGENGCTCWWNPVFAHEPQPDKWLDPAEQVRLALEAGCGEPLPDQDDDDE